MRNAVPAPTVRALIYIREAGRELTFDLELEDCEVTSREPFPSFNGSPLGQPPFNFDRRSFEIKGKSKQAKMEMGSASYQRELESRFEELWNEWAGLPIGLEVHSASPSRTRQYAFNFWLAAHGVGPYVEEEAKS